MKKWRFLLPTSWNKNKIQYYTQITRCAQWRTLFVLSIWLERLVIVDWISLCPSTLIISYIINSSRARTYSYTYSNIWRIIKKITITVIKGMRTSKQTVEIPVWKNVLNVQDNCPQHWVHCSPMLSTNVPNVEDIFCVVFLLLIFPVFIIFVVAWKQFYLQGSSTKNAFYLCI